MAQGSVVISVDAELGWGFHDLPDLPRRRIESARYGWRKLGDLCERYDVPATWAVVGHLLLSECDGRHDRHPTPPDWFRRERADWADRPDLRFGSDLVRALTDSPVDHEIGCHTFSHVCFDDHRLDAETVRAELRAATDVAAALGIEYDSFVFPRNAVGYRDVLAQEGFSAYRGGRSLDGGSGGRLAKIAAAASPGRLRMPQPHVDEYGLVNVPPSLFLFGFEGPARRACEAVWTDPVFRQATALVDRALETGSVAHLWLHPNNLTGSADVERVRRILRYVDERRDDGLRVETMADVAERVR